MPNLLKIIWLSCPILMSAGTAISQSSPAVLSSRAYGLGDIGVTFQDIHSIYSNQAGLVFLNSWAVQATASRRFELRELAQVNLAFGKRLADHGTLFASVRSFGFSAYRESMLAAGYARKLSTDLAIAVQFNLYQFEIEGYGTALSPGYELALQQRITSSVVVGLQLINPVPMQVHKEIDVPSVLTLGLSYKPSNDVSIYGEVEKDENFDPRFKIGIEYALHKAFWIRFGASSGPGMFHGGVSYVLSNGLSIDVAAAYHQQLGITPAVGISFTGN